MAVYLYDLTSLVGRKRNAGRQVVWGGFEFQRQTALIVAGSVVVSILPSIVFEPLLKMYVIFIPVLFAITGLFFFQMRAQSGLHLKIYRAALDKKRLNPGQAFLCWRPVGDGVGEGVIRMSSIPNDTAVDALASPARPPVFAVPEGKHVLGHAGTSVAFALDSLDGQGYARNPSDRPARTVPDTPAPTRRGRHAAVSDDGDSGRLAHALDGLS